MMPTDTTASRPEPPLDNLVSESPAQSAAAVAISIRGPSSSAVKSELYSNVRNALRCVWILCCQEIDPICSL